MADIFLSYAREDLALAQKLSAALESAGYSVWWDRNLAGGTRYLDATEAELNAAKAVLVLWTKSSITSHWVADEAAAGRDTGRLVPITPDGSTPPLGFRQFQVIDFIPWSEVAHDAPFCDLISAVAGLVSPAASPAATPVSAGRSAADPQAAVAIAVLPFVNMSSDPEQEYFSDGLSEELINQLAQVKRLRTAGRTSSFAFKGQAADFRTIGEKLGVSHVLEGSVRKVGQRLRITAQLIKCSDGFHLWSERFDRELTDIFQIQDEIARAVAGALSVALGVGAQRLDYGGTRSFEAFDQFLKGRISGAQFDARQLNSHREHLRRAVAIDPGYALAWANLSILLARLRNLLSTREAEHFAAERDEATQRARAIAPDLPSANVAEGWLQADRKNWLEAEESFVRAITPGPAHDPAAEGMVGGYLASTGRVREGLMLREKMRDSDPLSLGWSDLVSSSYLVLGEWKSFDAEYKRSQDLHGNRGQIEFWQLMRLMMGGATPARIKAQFRRVTAGPAPDELMQAVSVVHASPEKAVAVLRQNLDAPPQQLFKIAQLAGFFGGTDLAMEALRKAAPDAGVPSLQLLWLPALGEVRRDPRFKELMREIGLAQFWRISGKWPDFARPLGSNDFQVF